MKPFGQDRVAVCLVFTFAAIVLSWNLWNVGIASGYIDPILHFGAQDEAIYTRESIAMAREGNWMVPTFLGRWVFEKPPLLVWLSAMSMKVFGIGRMGARLPVVLAGALVCTLCFVMVRRQRSAAAGLATAAMAISSQVLFTMSRHNMTDILLAAASVCMFDILLRDPGLASPRSLAGFVIAAAAGMLAKSAAGILVVAVMGIVVGLGRRRWERAVPAAIAAILLASPWFIYNYAVHREWFLADMGFQLITVGKATHQNAPQNHVWFYAVRILTSDGIPLVLAILGVPALWQAVRRRDPVGWLAAAYFAVYFAAVMAFRFNSEQYLCWFIPSVILIAGLYSPILTTRGAAITIAALVIACSLRIAFPESAMGVDMRSGTTLSAAPVLSRYCNEHRAVTLYVLGVDDEFYSAALPLFQVRYGWVDSTDLVAREHPHLAHLGILISGPELSNLRSLLPIYRERLRQWGLDSTRAVATAISAHDSTALLRLIAEHPESDFLVARSILADPSAALSHRVVFANSDFMLLESESPAGTHTPAWTCRM